MSRPLAPRGGNDLVFTPYPLAKQIVDHFNPCGSFLDPCKGQGVFVQAAEERRKLHGTVSFTSWCEITEGRDFLARDFKGFRFKYIITNPPWSKFRPFLIKSMEVADNVIFLCLVNAFFMRARQTDIQAAHFCMKEILFVPTPPKPWPQTGFSLGAVHIQRGYSGPVTHSYSWQP